MSWSRLKFRSGLGVDPVPSPTLQDFEEVLRQRSKDAAAELSCRSAAIVAAAAKKGMLSSSRRVFEHLDALESVWGAAASDVITELRRWVAATGLKKTDLRKAAEAELIRLAPLLITASKVRQAQHQLQNGTMISEADRRLIALPADAEFRLRQFDIGMDTAEVVKKPSGLSRTLAWLWGHSAQIVVGVAIAAIAAWLGLT
jgi:hypothetical protein